jgi:hypothetical protein
MLLAYYVAYSPSLGLAPTAQARLPHFWDARLFFALRLPGFTHMVLSARAAVARARQQS